MPSPEALTITASQFTDVTGIRRETVGRERERLGACGLHAKRGTGRGIFSPNCSGKDMPARRHVAERDPCNRLRLARLLAERQQLEMAGRRRGAADARRCVLGDGDFFPVCAASVARIADDACRQVSGHVRSEILHARRGCGVGRAFTGAGAAVVVRDPTTEAGDHPRGSGHDVREAGAA